MSRPPVVAPAAIPAAVLFDCDGVIVDSEPILFDLLRSELASRGLPLSRAVIARDFVGGTMASVAERARDLGADLPPDWPQRFYDRLYPRLALGTPLIPGIESVLDALDAAGIPYAVGSNGAPEKMRITLGQHPRILARLERHLYSGQALGCPKPDPGLYLHAARALGVEPARAVVIDDSPSGARAAGRAGMRCLGYAAHDDGARLAAEGAEVFHRMADLPALLGL